MRRVEFSDGEGLCWEDLRMVGQLSDRALSRNLLAPKIEPLVALYGTSYPFLISGATVALSGTGNRTATLAAGHFIQGGSAIADDDDVGVATGDFAGVALVHDAPTSGTDWRRDVIEIRINSESQTETETRDMKDAVTGVVTTQSFNKRRVRTVDAQIKKGTDQTSEALADANEPTPTSGWVKAYSVLIPPTGSASITKVKDYRIRADLAALRPAIQLGSTQGTVNDWAPSGISGASVVRVPTPGTDLVITGISGGVDGRILVIESIGSDGSLIELLHDNAGSAAENRILVPGEVQATLADGCAIVLCYDATASRWRVIGGRYTVPQTVYVDPSSGQPVGSNFTWQGAGTTTAAYWDISTTNQVITFPLPLRVGDRIRSAKFHLRDASGGTISVRLVHSSASGATTAGDVMTSAGSGADQVITVTSLTGAAGKVGTSSPFWRAYFLTNSGSAMRIYGVELSIDRYLP